MIRFGEPETEADLAVSTQPTSAEKRKASASRTSGSKKRRTDQVAEEEARDVPLPYGLGTHYPYAYAYPGAPAPPPPAFHPTSPTNPSAEMGFNEFQWRLLNLCGEFYEAATELIVCGFLLYRSAAVVFNCGIEIDSPSRVVSSISAFKPWNWFRSDQCP